MAEFPHCLELKDINQICKTLEQIILHSVGPRGSTTLLSTDTGKVMITSNGHSVLRKLHFSHPLANLVIDSMSRTVNFTGDGSKTFILYLSEFIKELDIYEHGNHYSGRNLYICSLQKVKMGITENLFSYLTERVPQSMQCYSSDIARSIIKTCLCNSFPMRIVDHFAVLLNDMINVHPDYAANLQEKLQMILDNFDQICVKIPNLPYIESKTLPPFIIQRKFAVFNQKHRSEEVRFVVCQFPITGHPENFETREIIQLQSEVGIKRFMNHHRMLLQAFIDNCSSNNVNLVLCTEQISDQALQLFESSGISVLHHIEDEDCEWLLSNLKISPCISILEKCEERMFHVADSCCPLIINGRQCVHLQLKRDLNLCKMLLVCAPTEGLCNQVVSNLQRSLKALLMCFYSEYLRTSINKDCEINGKSTIGKLAVIGGGGTFEFLVSEFLSNFKDENKCPNIKVVCDLLIKALLHLPRVLFQNNSPYKEINLKQYIDCVEEIKKQKEVKSLGFNRNGKVSDLFSEEILEPIELKIHILLSVIELLQQILHIDSIVGIRKTMDCDKHD